MFPCEKLLRQEESSSSTPSRTFRLWSLDSGEGINDTVITQILYMQRGVRVNLIAYNDYDDCEKASHVLFVCF